MNQNTHLIIGAFVALTALPTAYSQLVVDAGGPRNLTYSESKDSSGFDATVSGSANPSLAFSYFRSGLKVGGIPESPTTILTLGASLKATAIDGLQEFFKFDRVPQLNFSAVANVTWDAGSLYSINLNYTGTYVQYAIFDSTRSSGSEFYTRDWAGGSPMLTLSLQPSLAPAFGFAISAGYLPTNNYAALKKVTVGNSLGSSGTNTAVGGGKIARLGKFNTYNAFPITFLTSYTLQSTNLNNFLKGFPHIFGWHLLTPANDYDVVISPYGSVVPRDEGEPQHSIGLNLVIESITSEPKLKEGEREAPGKQKLSYPLGVFIERQNPFSGKPSTSVGAALMYHFP